MNYNKYNKEDLNAMLAIGYAIDAFKQDTRDLVNEYCKENKLNPSKVYIRLEQREDSHRPDSCDVFFLGTLKELKDYEPEVSLLYTANCNIHIKTSLEIEESEAYDDHDPNDYDARVSLLDFEYFEHDESEYTKKEFIRMLKDRAL